MGDGFHRINPQRPSNIWKYSVPDGKGGLTRIVFAYDYWNPDPIFQDIGYFFVTRSMAATMRAAGFTGFALEDVPTIKSKEYDETLNPPNPEPVCWLKVHGEHGKDDFALQLNAYLIVSDRALASLREHGLERAEVLGYDPEMRPPTMAEVRAKWESRLRGRAQ